MLKLKDANAHVIHPFTIMHCVSKMILLLFFCLAHNFCAFHIAFQKSNANNRRLQYGIHASCFKVLSTLVSRSPLQLRDKDVDDEEEGGEPFDKQAVGKSTRDQTVKRIQPAQNDKSRETSTATVDGSFSTPQQNNLTSSANFDVKKIGLASKQDDQDKSDLERYTTDIFFTKEIPGVKDGIQSQTKLLQEIKAGAKNAEKVRKRLEALKITGNPKAPKLKKKTKADLENEEDDLAREYAEQDKLRQEIVEEMRKLMPNDTSGSTSGSGATKDLVGDTSTFEKLERNMERSRNDLLAELEKALPSDLKEELLYMAEANPEKTFLEDKQSSSLDSYGERLAKQAEIKKDREKEILEKIDRQIDSFLSGEFSGWTSESPKPCLNLDHIDVVTIVLESLYNMNYPTPDHGSAVAIVFTHPLEDFELLSPSGNEWRELVRRSPTPKILTSRLQRSRFRILREFEKCKVTELELLGDSQNEQKVQVDLVDDVGREVQTLFSLKKSGVWKIHSIQILKDSYYDSSKPIIK